MPFFAGLLLRSWNLNIPLFLSCRFFSAVSRATGLHFELGCRFCNLYHARNWSAIAKTAWSIWPVV